ncbi:MAG: NAD(P)H-binding protein [Bacteroidales bacterium]|nr:NAD(P)H-binding protein [Bacteroidales bacterium]
MKKKAIILGATGLTGSHLLELLLNDPNYDAVKVFTRKKLPNIHPKLEEYEIDLLKLSDYADKFTADVVFCCIGTTKAKTPNKELYRAVDYGIPVEAAKLCKKNAINSFIVISAIGANPQSKVFYNRLKGEMERDVLAQQIEHTQLLQPSLIVGNREEKRIGEDLSKQFMKLFGFLIPARYKMIEGKTIAKAMVQMANNPTKEHIVPSEKIKEIAKQYE